MQKKSRVFDKRTVDRYREKGIIKKDEYETHLKNLPDDAANATYVQMDIHDAELGEGESGAGDEN